jgi:hypothetical protein
MAEMNEAERKKRIDEELKERIFAGGEAEGQAVLAFQAIRGACNLLICAAENDAHQLDTEAFYFVSNAIQEHLDKIERHVAELKKMRGEDD